MNEVKWNRAGGSGWGEETFYEHHPLEEGQLRRGMEV